MHKIRLDNYFGFQSQPLAIHRTLPELNDVEHDHEFDELVIVDQGCGTHVINGEHRFIQTGDVFYVDQHDFHYYQNLGSLGLTNILMRPDLPFQHIPPLRQIIRLPDDSSGQHHWRLGLKHRKIFFSLVEQISTTLDENKSVMAGMKREGLLLQMLSLLSYEETRPAHLTDEASIERLLNFVRSNHCDNIDWQQLSQDYGLSERTLYRKIKSLTGYTPEHYLLMLRLRTARERLKNSDDTILSIALSCGFKSLSSFSRNFKRIYSYSPVQQRKIAT